jgi:hypothetical protein
MMRAVQLFPHISSLCFPEMQNGNSHNPGGLSFEVVPESCIKNEHIVLALGTPINQVICALKNASRVIRNIELVYDNREPFGRDIIIILKNDGIKLTFDSKQQLLKVGFGCWEDSFNI